MTTGAGVRPADRAAHDQTMSVPSSSHLVLLNHVAGGLLTRPLSQGRCLHDVLAASPSPSLTPALPGPASGCHSCCSSIFTAPSRRARGPRGRGLMHLLSQVIAANARSHRRGQGTHAQARDKGSAAPPSCALFRPSSPRFRHWFFAQATCTDDEDGIAGSRCPACAQREIMISTPVRPSLAAHHPLARGLRAPSRSSSSKAAAAAVGDGRSLRRARRSSDASW